MSCWAFSSCSSIRIASRAPAVASIIARTSTETYRDSKKPLRQIAEELNVDLIVEGWVTKAGDRVRVTLAPAHEARLKRRETIDPAVFDQYLRGRHAWNLRTPEGLQTAIKFFSEAVRLEPTRDTRNWPPIRPRMAAG